MSLYLLKNDSITLQVNELGAELTSIMDYKTATEFLWNADPTYWKRSSPVLFPFVGTLKDKAYTYQGKTYSMQPHGFARDMAFSLISQSENELWFSLEATEETKKCYPFLFRLELGYRLEGRTITVFWRVLNQGKETMYFSIGGHPAFQCPIKQMGEQSDYYLRFDTVQPLHYLLIDEKGLAVKLPKQQQKLLLPDNGLLSIHPHMFDHDAFIIEDDQCHQVSLLTPNKEPYISVTFDAPLFGLWSPAGKNAPFICIEPWYGRCDSADFNGTLEAREWGNTLEAGEEFDAAYTITIHSLN